MQKVGFVMKEGVIYKEDGKSVEPVVAEAASAPSIAQGEELLGY